MLGLDNPIHILFLLVIALLVFGAKRLPEMGKSLGEGLRGFKESVSGDTHLSHMTSDVTAARVTDVAAVAPMPMLAQPAREHATEWATEPRSEQTPVTPVTPVA
jgi:sec-independent protein translocase protein TatA